LHDLSHLRRKQIQGNSGANGGPKGRNGKVGGKTIVRVPKGTLVYEIHN
jgi:GTPase involved in cell partitioning and DNA repair